MKASKIIQVILAGIVTLYSLYLFNTLPRGLQKYFMLFLVCGGSYTILSLMYNIKPPFRKKNREKQPGNTPE
jgi:hypothetical protein